ncbi:response regulator [Roseivirga sp. BDSF3-8]|uniref:response regulator n=1 Tax=Roseivirga sp. BDSF3-8 TaxID=3241598 RepID=UPI00353243D7
MINIIIADDHRLVVDGLKLMLHSQPDIHLIGEAYSGDDVLRLVKKAEKADLIIMDINMPNGDGIQTTRYLKEHHPDIKILVLTMYKKPEFIRNLLKSGASGYVLKNTEQSTLMNAIRSIAGGETFFTPDISRTVMESLVGHTRQRTFELTQREKDVLRLIVEECTTPEIAERLYISTHTVETHRKNLLSKLNVRNTVGLVKYALENGIHEVGRF